MSTLSLNKLGGLSLVLGPLLAFAFFLIQPGGLLIESAKPSDSAALIAAAADNVVLSNLTAIVIALGIIMTTYGMYVVQAGLRGSGNGESLALAGFLLLLFGNVGWVMAQGLTLIAADAQSPQAIEAMAPVYSVRLGLILMPGLAIALGFFVFSLALSARPAFNKIAAWIVALASIVALVSYIIAISDPSRLDSALAIARVCYIAWVVWPIMLGVGLLKADAPVRD